MKRTVALVSILALAAAAGGLFLWRARFRPSPPPERSPKTVAVTIYFINRAYVQSGDERLPHLLPEKRNISPADGGLAAAAVRALQSQPSSPGAARVIGKDIRVRRVWVEGGVAYVDFARANLSGGSLEEMLLVEGTVKTLTSLPGIEAVRFMVEGRPAETLMGHVAVDKPLGPEDLP
ncbi:MAG: GerMN domain-containing protein [Firmicutes bacterium]|nr:GerMN domain-containing protein [Bacillota bacterium]